MVLTGYFAAVLYALICLLVAWLVYKLGLSKKYTRKIVHILVGFEWVILYHFMGAGIHFLIVCLLFLTILTISYKGKLMPMISSDSDNAPGTVYYAVAMSGVAFVGCFVPEIMIPFGIGVFCTSVGDGFAGVIGQIFTKRNPQIYENKTLVGTIANFVMSTLCAFVLPLLYGMQLSVWQSMAIGALSMGLELVTGGGFDNVTITWGTTALAYGFMYFSDIGEYIIPILLTVPMIMFARAKNALTTGGLVAALLLDAFVSVAFGNFGFVTLCIFFVGSIIIDKIKKCMIKGGRNPVEKKGDCRDFIQVFSNGVVCAIASVAFIVTRETILLLPFVASIAEAFADTAASGLGVFADKTFDPFRFKKCEKGMSGGMSLIGTLASIVAAAFIALSAICWGRIGFGVTEFWIVTFSGFLGALFDSFLGSLIQAKYKCKVCKKITEKETHCGEETQLCSGLSFIDNDVVNAASCAFSAVIAIVMGVFF